MSKYPKTITYEDLDGNKKTTVVKDEFEQRVLENQIEKQMQLKSELDVASEVFNMEMAALKKAMKGKSKEEQAEEKLNKLKQNFGEAEISILADKSLDSDEKRKALREVKEIREEQAKLDREEENLIRKANDKVAAEKWKKLPLFQKIVRWIAFVLVLSLIFFILFWTCSQLFISN